MSDIEYWALLDFRPALPGWRAAYLDEREPRGFGTEPVVGWFIQEKRVDYSGSLDAPDDRAEDRDRRVVAAWIEDGIVVEADYIFAILAPEQSDPDDAWVARAREEEDRAWEQECARAARARAEREKQLPSADDVRGILK